MKKDFLAIPDFTTEEIKETFQLASDMKSGKMKPLPLKDKTVACIFYKPSLRTEVILEVGIAQPGSKKLERIAKILDFNQEICNLTCC